MSEALTDHPGRCTLPSCRVSQGTGPCALGLSLIDCENFEPEPDYDPQQRPVEVSRTPGQPAAPADDSPAESPPLDGPRRVEDLALDPLVRPNADAGAGETMAVQAQSGPGGRRRVRRPDGPQDTIVFDGSSVALSTGLALTAHEAHNLMASEAVTLVLIAGPPDAGKTTLLASVYEQLLEGPISGWSFAGSRTLLALCQRAYWASTASGGIRPVTPRTRYDSARPWVHLRFASSDDARSVLVADISGEYFSTLASGGDIGDAAGLVARADHLLHVLDSELLVERRERQRALGSTESLIRRMAERSHFDGRARHTIVLTKADLCPGDFRSEALARAAAWAERWLGGADVIEVAARPANHDIPWGVDRLLESILSTRTPAPASIAPVSLRSTLARLSQGGTRLLPLTVDGSGPV